MKLVLLLELVILYLIGDDIKVINFGHVDYEDFTQHKDSERRKSFRSRHNCDPVKELNKLSARYWTCQYLW